ncbi:hypothetical protein OAK25_02955 [Synechococcus sp. AH-551-P10]|nr:hypothetical protein [Synechococcus sp. AH-551-P10]
MTLLAGTYKLDWHIQSPKALAFTRNPSDTDVSPATYTADGSSDLLIVDQQRDIAIDGSDAADSVIISTDALAASALYDYNVRGFAGNDTYTVNASLIQNSVFNGNVGNDTMTIGDRVNTTNFNGSFFLGGKGDDTVRAFDVSNGEVNGNIGDDTIRVNNTFAEGFNQYVGGGQGNDRITVQGDFTNSIIDGNKGKDTVDVLAGDHDGTVVNGGEGDDVLRSESVGGAKGLNINGDLGNDTIVVAGIYGADVTGGEGSDTILSGSIAGQDSTIDAGVGNDTIILANGAALANSTETIVFDSGDSVAASATSFAGAAGPGSVIAAGDTITFGNGVDFLGAFGPGTDVIDIDFTPGNTPAQGVIDLGPGGTGATLIDTLEAGVIYEVYGFYSNNDGRKGGVFTAATEAAAFTGGVSNVTAAGTGSALYIVGGENNSLGTVFESSSNMFITNQDLSLSSFV